MTGLLTGIQGKPALAAVLDRPPSGTDIDNILTSLPPALYIRAGGILCKYLVSWLRVGALEGCQGSALPGGNVFYAMCYLCFVCVCRSAWVYGVCVTVLSLCLVYSVQPFFQYISVPEFPSCLLISSNWSKFFAFNIFCGDYLQSSLHLMLQIWWKPLLWKMCQ